MENNEQLQREIEQAQAIVDQLGGLRSLRCMVGLHSGVILHGGFQFSFKGSRKVNKVVIKLNANDYYDVDFYQWQPSKFDSVLKASACDVSAERLRPLFEEVTGLSIGLPIYTVANILSASGMI